jgi:oligosaccharide repeat unit polymerase
VTFEEILFFVSIWAGMLTLAYLLGNRFVGVTLFFAAVTFLYMLLPMLFYSRDYAQFSFLLPLACALAIAGFWLGFTHGGSERLIHRVELTQLNIKRALRSAALLGAISTLMLLAINPTVFIEVADYDKRVALQGEHGFQAFLLIQLVIAATVWNLVELSRRRWKTAFAIAAATLAWAFYSNHKFSMLTTLSLLFCWWVYRGWQGKASLRVALVGLAALPAVLALLLFYATVRAKGFAGDTIDVWWSNFDRMGESGGVQVGDFDGPYSVLTMHLREPGTSTLYSAPYITQLPVLLPRALRGNFTDIGEAYAMWVLGPSYLPGMGFAFSPWAEGYGTFGVPGFFIEALLFGLLTRLLLRVLQRLLGHNTLPFFFTITMIVLFQRGYLVGQLKNVAVYVSPFLFVWWFMGTVSKPVPVTGPTVRGAPVPVPTPVSGEEGA